MSLVDSDCLDLHPQHAPASLMQHHDLGGLQVRKRTVNRQLIHLSQPANDLHLTAESHRTRNPTLATQRRRRNPNGRQDPG